LLQVGVKFAILRLLIQLIAHNNKLPQVQEIGLSYPGNWSLYISSKLKK